MIKIDGNTTQVSGELHEILGDTTHLLRILYKQLVQIEGKEKANEYFADMGRMAVMTDEEMLQEMKDVIKE